MSTTQQRAREFLKMNGLSQTRENILLLEEIGNSNTGPVITDLISEETVGNGVQVDGVLIKDGTLRGLAALTSATGAIDGAFIKADIKQSISGAGAINVTTYKTEITTTGSDAYTLVDGVVTGQLKKIHMIVYGGQGNLQPANIAISTGILFRAVGDEATLMWNGSSWVIIDTANVLGDGATPTPF